jgi:hypothetical protein
MQKSLLSILASFLLIFFLNPGLHAQCNITPCTVPVPSVDAQNACVLPNPAALNCYHGSTSFDAPISLPPFWCLTVENNHFFAFKADSTTAVFRICTNGCLPDGAIQAAVLSTFDCIDFQFVSPCLEKVITGTCQDLVASNLNVGEVYYLMIDGYSGFQCDYTINSVGCPVGTTVANKPSQQMKVYPNPVSEFENTLTVEIQGLDLRGFTLKLTDLVGRVYLSKKVDQATEKIVLETGQIPSGTYFVQTWQDGKILATGMFLKI